MKTVIRLLVVFLIPWGVQAKEKVSPMALSARSILPQWVHNPDTLHYYIQSKYYTRPESCDALGEAEWLCHIPCGEACRIDGFFDVNERRELILPRTSVPYYWLPQWRMIIGMALVEVPMGWELSLVWLALDTLMVDRYPLFSAVDQAITSFQLFPRGKRIGFDTEYCVQELGCWKDEFRLKRGELVLKSHRVRRETP